jgi:hypothetical protein
LTTLLFNNKIIAIRYSRGIMVDKETVSLLTACFNRLPEEKQSEILGIAEAFTFAQRGADSDPWGALCGILQEPLNKSPLTPGTMSV